MKKPRGYWTKETVKKEVESILAEHGKVNVHFIGTNYNSVYQALRREYGNVENFMKETGLELNVIERKPRGYWTKERLEETIYNRYKEGKSVKQKPVIKDEGNGFIEAVYSKYGTWLRFLTVSGIDLKALTEYEYVPEEKWTKEKFKQELESFSEENKLSPKEVMENQVGLYNQAKRIYGTWYKALEENGYDPNDHYVVSREKNYWTKENVLKYLSNRYKKGETISAGVMNSGGHGTVYRKGLEHFGSWAEVRKAVNEYVEMNPLV